MNNNILSRMASLSIKLNKAALLLVWGLVALAAGSAQAAVYTWTGVDSGDWADADNWTTDSVLYATPRLAAAAGVGDESEVVINNSINLDQFTRYNPTTIKSLTFGTDSDGAYALGLRANTGADRDLTFEADAGNATLTVPSGSAGDKTIGSFEGSLTDGEVVLVSNLDITHNGVGNLTFACEIRGPGDLNVAGSGATVFSGINTYTGNTTVNGALTLSDDAQLAFTIGTNGANNALSGSGSVALEGDFILNLAGAGRTVGDSWQLVDVDTLTETFGTSFSLRSTAGSFTESNGVWSISENGTDFEFAENTGLLTVVSALPAADWMSGQWGIGWRFRADEKDEIANWDVDTLVSQVLSIPGGVDYVVFNLSDGAHGDAYIAPHSVLTAITPSATPDDDRDLFMEMATGFQAAGIKVIAYVAAQGPAMLKHGAESAFDSVEVSSNVFTSVAMDNWSNYVYSVYNITNFADEREMYKRAFGEVIIDEFAARYGSLINGWWFDNGDENYDAPLLYYIVKKYNPNCAVGTNSELSYNTDFLNGHPTPLQSYPANDLINLPMLTAIEATPDGYLYKGTQPNLGHMFMALGELWNSGDIVWPLDQAADWMTRCLNAGGAWTWNVDLDDDNSMIRADSATYFTDLNAEVAAMLASNTAAPTFLQDSMDGGNAEFGVAYTGSLAGAATDANGDMLTYAIAPNGPDWLTVSTNGMLSGTPYNTLDLGMNRFTLVAADGKGRIGLAELEIYVTDEFGSDIAYSHVSFDDLRGNLSDGTINGLDASDTSVTITKAEDGNDVVLSLSIINQDFDGGASDNSLSWDVRVKGFSGGTYTLNGSDSSVALGTNVPVGTLDNEFGVSGGDTRFVDSGESIQFSVENVILTADAHATVQFDGFDGMYATAGTYILGIGSGGLESMTSAGENLSFPSPTVLTLTSTGFERLRDLDGGFTIYPNNVPYFLARVVEISTSEGAAYSETLADLGVSATDADGDTLTYSKGSGPSWLDVAADGTLSGTPSANDMGLNVFTVEVSDGKTGTDQVVLHMTVVEPLLAHWTLDTGSGTTAVDDTGNGYDGTISDGEWTNGVNGGALDFNGTSSQVTLPSMAFNAINNEISIAMWVYGAETQPRNDSLFYAEDANGKRVLNIILPWGSSTVLWDAGNVGAVYDRISKEASSSDFMGAWNHWVFTKNATAGVGEMEIYLNGALWHSETGKTHTIVGITDATFGSRIDSLFYDGMMDDVKLYGIALSAPEIAALFEEYSMSGIPVDWLSDYGLPITDSVGSENPDGDALVTLAEYALGGVPTNAANTGYPISASLLQAGGTHWFEYVHPRRKDSESELTYILESSFNLISNDWKTGTYEELPDTGNLDDDFEAVTNRFDTTGKTNEFIRLRIDAL